MSTPSSSALDWRVVAHMIDHTVLKPESTREQIVKLCAEAAQYDFAAVCVAPMWIATAAALLRDTPVKVATVIGFPHGNTVTTAKRAEASDALRLGADELDMVINIGALKSNDNERVVTDIRAVVQAGHASGAMVKVILETALLKNEEKVRACKLALEAGADFVKTSTGFSGGGATVEDVSLMRRAVGQRAGVKASGGIRSAADALKMIEAGADRLGTSAGVTIVRELGAS